MGYVLFSDAIYKYLDEGNLVSFSEDGTHRYLFDYLNADMSPVPNLLMQHCSTRMDMDILEPISYNKSGNVVEQILPILEPVHPYYKEEIRKTISNAIGEYFNELLLYLIEQCGNTALGEKVNKDWYTDRLWVLINDIYIPQYVDKGPDDFFHEFEEKMGKLNIPKDIDEDTVILGKSMAPVNKPILFSHEIYTQKEISNMLYYILDTDVDELNELSHQQRVWLYGNIFNTDLDVSKNMSFFKQTVFEKGVDRSQEAEEAGELYDMFKPLYSLRSIDAVHCGIPENIKGKISSAVNRAKTISSHEVYEKYKIDNLSQLLILEIVHMIRDKKIIRACKNCGKYFIISNRRVSYCDRIDESGHMCSEVGSIRSFQKKRDEDEALIIYTRAYKTHFARQKKGTMAKDDFTAWCDEARKKLDKVRAGEYDFEEFKEWLKK